MSAVTIDVAGRRIDSILREVDVYSTEGYDVIFELGESPSPERVLKILKATTLKYKVDVTIRHAELKEFIQTGLAGATAGAFIAGVGFMVLAFATKNPIKIINFFKAFGIGFALGALFGISSTQIKELRVYKLRGETKIKFVANKG